MIDLPAELLPAWVAAPLAVAVGIALAVRVAGDGIKAWLEARNLKDDEDELPDHLKALIAPYTELAGRVVALEKKVDALTEELHAKDLELLTLRARVEALGTKVAALAALLTDEVAFVLDWIEDGARPPLPLAKVAAIRARVSALVDPPDPPSSD